MKLALPTGRPGQALALALTVLAATAVWVMGIAPLARWYVERAEALQQRRMFAAHAAALAADLPRLRRLADQPGGAHRPLAALAGSSDAVASATLQGLLQKMAGDAGTSLSTIATLPAVPVGAYRRIGLHITMTASWSQFIRLLQTVETATPRMTVDDVTLHSSSMTLSGMVDPPIQASFTVSTFRSLRPDTATR
jgi:general secretion pathway protein M